MSTLVEVAPGPQARQSSSNGSSSSEASDHSDIAIQFFDLMYAKKHPRDLTKSPGQAHKVSKGPKQVQADSEGELATGQDTGIAGQATAQASGQDAVQDRARAHMIAQRLIAMGDKLERDSRLMKDLKDALEKEFRLRGVFGMAYENFSGVCRSVLTRAKSSIRSGWDQVYLLYYGHYLMGEELVSQAGQEDARDRIAVTSHYLDDMMREFRLDEWVDAQGGMDPASIGQSASTESTVVDIPMPSSQREEGTSVDK